MFPRSRAILGRATQRRSRVLGRRWLIIGVVVGSALVVATGGAMLDVASTHPAPAFETTVVDLVLPGSPAKPDHVPGGSGQLAVAGKNASPDASPDRLQFSHARLEAPIEDPAATSSSPPATNPSVLDHEAVTVANAKPAPSASAMPSANPGTTAAVDTEAPTTRAPAHRVTVSSGDSLYLIFKRLGLPQRDLALMTGSKPLAKKLARIAPRQEIEFYVDTQSRLTRLVHRLDRIRSLHVSRNGDTFTFDEVVEPPEVAVATATGVIDSSLFEAGQRAGLSDNIIMQMAEIFGWDVDFALDIRDGDRFALVYEEQFKDGEKVGEGPIIAAEFTNRGRRIRTVRYVRKAFLRTPVNFTRISSRFSFSRRHPLLHKMRAHRGGRLRGSPRGTAVKASGDGKVVFAGRKGGYGRTIILRHGSIYTTLYAHLSRFSKGVGPGKRVEQGQIIGYVGSTGLATGPHPPLRVPCPRRPPRPRSRSSLPQAAPLAQGYMADFREKCEALARGARSDRPYIRRDRATDPVAGRSAASGVRPGPAHACQRTTTGLLAPPGAAARWRWRRRGLGAWSARFRK